MHSIDNLSAVGITPLQGRQISPLQKWWIEDLQAATKAGNK
jgi:hypothetical protein